MINYVFRRLDVQRRRGCADRGAASDFLAAEWHLPDREVLGRSRDLSKGFVDERIHPYYGPICGCDGEQSISLAVHKLINYKPTPKTKPLTDADMLAVVHSVALALGMAGHSNIYHVFLPPGQE